MRGAPGLIGASTDAGGRVMTFGSALAAEGEPGPEPDGDLALAFSFP